MNTEWDAIVESLRAQIDAKHAAREAGLQTCRKVIQKCGKGIRHMHRNEFDSARDLVASARQLIDEARTVLGPHPDLYYAGYLQDAEKEYVEAEAVLRIILDEAPPPPESLGVHLTSYLNGMAEAASECRRYVLDAMRRGEAATAERCLLVMEDIYDQLVTFDYPDALTGGLRRTCDALRAVLERTRSDFALTTTQKELHASLERAMQTFADN